MALIQLNTRYRRLIVFMFFASLLIVALKPTGLTHLCVALTSLLMITIPCGQHFINKDKTLWIVRQIYFAALATAWFFWAIRTW